MADVDSVESVLTERIGPLPAVAWAGLAIAGIYLVHWYEKRNAPASTSATASSDPLAPGAGIDTLVTSGYDAGYASGGDNGLSSSPTAADTSTTPGTPTPQNNFAWSRMAANALIAQGGDPLAIEAALAQYLTGMPLNATEQAIVSQAISMFGSPPDGVLAPVLANAGGSTTITSTAPTSSSPSTTTVTTVAPAPAPAPAAPAPAPSGQPIVYTVQPGDTLTGIAANGNRMFGLNNSWQDIYNTNKETIDSTAQAHGLAGGGHWIFPGQKLIIP